MLPEAILAAALTAAVYHHVAYPLVLSRLAHRMRRNGVGVPARLNDEDLPRVALVLPAHNEAAVIERRIANCAAIDYPRDKLDIVIACDGCTDATAALARAALEGRADLEHVRLVEFAENQGKIAVLNAIIPTLTCDIVALSDVSAMLQPDAFKRAAAHFADRAIGVVCPTYTLGAASSEGERAYWAYQTHIKACESAFGAPIGAHGAFYLFRREEWEALPADTINDDVIIPMRIVGRGYRAVYDTEIVATEVETTRPDQEWRRRVRIGAGNLQQVLRLGKLADPRRPGLAFVFLSGKALRCVIPFMGCAAALTIIITAISGDPFMTSLLQTQTIVLGATVPQVARRLPLLSRLATWLGYLVEGYAASFVGSMRYVLGGERSPWRRAVNSAGAAGGSGGGSEQENYVPQAVLVCKRMLDIVCALGALAVMTVLFIPIAIAIKLESRGPIFYRQQRVGRITPSKVDLFNLIKFRTMRSDAEARSGAVWAAKNDPRITRVGGFMRKTRLDELPQCFNVLRGEMSVIGPRPERPGFYNKLEDAIPFYAERTYGLKPGITGLAQVNQAYDSCIEDVRNKVLYDHAYAAQLTTVRGWLRTDFGTIFKTVAVMALGKGQ